MVISHFTPDDGWDHSDELSRFQKNVNGNIIKILRSLYPGKKIVLFHIKGQNLFTSLSKELGEDSDGSVTESYYTAYSKDRTISGSSGSSLMTRSSDCSYRGISPLTRSSDGSFGGTSPLIRCSDGSFGGTSPLTRSSDFSFGGGSSTSRPSDWFKGGPLVIRSTDGSFSDNPFMARTSYATNKSLASRGCSFCSSNHETKQVYMSHTLKALVKGKWIITCPVLRAHVCHLCQATGDTAHTISYCPFMFSKNGKKSSVAWRLKHTTRKANGTIRKCNYL